MSRAASIDAFVDGDGLKTLVAAAARAVERNQEEINALNVFPVPDGDTGTNMALTLAAVVDEAGVSREVGIEAVASAMARSALLGARGNSGLILAQFFKGIALGLDGAQILGGREFAIGLRRGAEAAYRAVESPVEGTMLTVMREAAEAADAALQESDSLDAVLAAACDRALESVARTPTMLEVLRLAGVVDAGGYGLSVVLAGALSWLRGDSDGAVTVAAPELIGVDKGAALRAGLRREFVDTVQDEIYGYCTNFVIEGEGLDPDRIRADAIKLGQSCVVAGDDRQVKLHLHPQDPGSILSYASSLGTLSRISILNMDEQTREWTQARRTELEDCQVAVVAVAAGEGLARIFTSVGMGASSVVPGGDTMNPSVAEIAAAVEASSADCVIVLPNNKNIVGTARQVRGLTSKTVIIVPTTTVQAGIAALLAFSPDRDAEVNVSAMSEAAAGVTAGAVTRATRDVNMNGRVVKRGDMIGLLNGSIVATGREAGSVAVDLLSHADIDGELITLYRGEEVSGDDAEGVAEALRALLDDVEIEVVDGGQPHYPYLIAIE